MGIAYFLFGAGLGVLVGFIIALYDPLMRCEDPDCDNCPFPRCDDSDCPLMWDSEKKSKRPK